jgi:trans-2,3-dihydro-3-hydroxyanthranilic acid synthase
MAIAAIEPYQVPDPLPANTARWTISPGRAVLLVHDMQHYFLRPFPPGQPPVSGLVPAAAALRRACAASGVPVAYTAQPGGMTRRQRGLLADFWGPGLSADREHRDIVPEVAPAPGDTVFTKWRPSGFFRTGLLDLLWATGRDQLLLCGVYAHVGILMTASDAFANDIQAFIAADAVADFSAEQHRMALEYAATRCAMVLPSAVVLESLAGHESPAGHDAPRGRDAEAGR